MELRPARETRYLAIASCILLSLGLYLNRWVAVLLAASIIGALAIARLHTRLQLSRVRAAGFEMRWSHPTQVFRMQRGQRLKLNGQLLNFSSTGICFRYLSVQSSPALRCKLDQTTGYLGPHSLIEFSVEIDAIRCGQHGLFGLDLEASSIPGAFFSALHFQSPIGIESYPRLVDRRHGANFRGQPSESSPLRPLAAPQGAGSGFYELREYASGDSLRDVAWRPSARKGKLLSIVREQPQSQRIWILVDAACDLSGTDQNDAILDVLLDAAAGIASSSLAGSHQVGLMLIGTKILGKVELAKKRDQLNRITELLCSGSHHHGANRSGLSTMQIAARVYDHFRHLSPGQRLETRDIAALAAAVLPKLKAAPFAQYRMAKVDNPESILRSYCAAFGLPDCPKWNESWYDVMSELARVIRQLASSKQKVDQIWILSPGPRDGQHAELAAAIGHLRRRHIQCHFVQPSLVPAQPSDPPLTALLIDNHERRMALAKGLLQKAGARFSKLGSTKLRKAKEHDRVSSS